MFCDNVGFLNSARVGERLVTTGKHFKVGNGSVEAIRIVVSDCTVDTVLLIFFLPHTVAWQTVAKHPPTTPETEIPPLKDGFQIYETHA